MKTNRPDEFAYMMAAEKVVNLAFTIEQVLIFVEDYEIKPDDEVRKVLIPLVKQLKKWLGDLPVDKVI